MVAQFIPIGEPAHDAERQAIRYLVEGLPSDYTVYGNPWLVERNGGVFELDAVVVAPHAIFVVEIKTYRGRIEGTDNDWWLPQKIRSPLKLNRLTAQILRGRLRNADYQAGQVWVEGLVFLSATTEVGVRGPASTDRVHTRRTILAALQEPALIERLSQGRSREAPAAWAQRDLLELFTGAQGGPKPVRHVREYEVTETLEHHDAFTELLGTNSLSSVERVLRIYNVPTLANDAQRERITERARWEAQVLGRLGRIEGILNADPPFADEAGIVLPLEYFRGITLTTWVERYGLDKHGHEKAGLRSRTELWIRIAQVIDEAHRQGVVHRLLRPEVILVDDQQEPQQIRVTGFDLAKQLTVDTAISLTTISDDRLAYAAPEVIAAFSSAEPASDQFSLGAILALLLTGKPLFESTRQLMAARRLMRRVRDMASNIPLTLDEAVSRMVNLSPAERFPTLVEAIAAVRRRDPQSPALFDLSASRRAPIDADNLLPGNRVGTDYEILSRLGQGGMSVVYAAKHLVSGKTRALKIARTEDVAEEALRGEYEALSKLDHPNVVRVIDLTKMVEGRLTLVMERVGGATLRQWLAAHPTPAPALQRRLAEDLLSGLEYLEQKSITHKDLKPDNLLVSDSGLTIIDFSLAAMSEDAPYGGTALYRDPASAQWTHGTDRFAASLCLFELYAGRHAFEGHVPEPGQHPLVREDDIDPSGLAEFFRKALNPVPEMRFPSARAMRDTLLVALGDDKAQSPSTPPPNQIDATTPLRFTGLSRRALNALTRCQVTTVGELLALSPSQVRGIHAIGSKTATDIIVLQESLRSQGLAASVAPYSMPEPQLVPELCDSPEPIHKLPVSDLLQSALAHANLPTVGAVASLTRSTLLSLPGIGRRKFAEVVEGLHQFQARSVGSSDGPHTLDRIWEQVSRPLSDAQRIAVERCIGITAEPEAQADVAEELKKFQSQISSELSKGLGRIDYSALADVNAALDTVLDGFGGIARLDEISARFEETWPAGVVSGAGIVRLLVRISSGRVHLLEVDGADQPLLARPLFDRETIRGFLAEVERLSHQWPLWEAEASRAALAAVLPDFQGNPLHLAERIAANVVSTAAGRLYEPPLDAKRTFEAILSTARRELTLDDLVAEVKVEFGAGALIPETNELLEILRDLDCQVQGQRVLPGRTDSIVADPALASDELPITHGIERSPEEVVRDMLRDAVTSRGFRMLITPPERHPEVARSVSAALGGTWLSFEDAFFADHAAEMPALERAERFVAQRVALTEAAEATLFGLLEEYGRPGQTIVLGDTGLFGLCDSLDLPRRLYDETLSGSRGFWVLVVPGVIHNRQPRFNEGPPMWHLEGATLPLLKPLPTE